jgi:ZIP family zinc transporter
LYERKAMTNKIPDILSLENIKKGDEHLHQLFHQISAGRLAMMIAIGIGAHNFSEGLAIGQSYVSGEFSLAILLIIGFGAHNTTEGFGIAGPLTGLIKRPSARFLFLLGIIGGGPTFIGTVLGGIWISDLAFILFLSAAGGALIYVSLLMYNAGRKQTTNTIIMIGILIGLSSGFLTDLIIELAGA